MAGKQFHNKEGHSLLENEQLSRNKRIQAFNGEEVQRKQLQTESKQTDPLETEADDAAQKIVHGDGIDSTSLSSTNAEPQTKQDELSQGLEKSISPQLEGSKGNGQPLDENVKGEMEGKMNTDLSDVNIHTDANASKMSEDINAKAFTHGQDIYFKDGNYDPNSPDGKELLGHELAHTQQQGKDGVNRKVQRTPEGDAAKEAFKALLKKKKAKNAVAAYEYLKSLEGSIRLEVLKDDPMKEWVELMEENLPVQYLESPDFGFQAGLETDELSKDPSESILLQHLNNPDTWKDAIKLDLLLKMIVQAGIQDDALPFVKSRWATLEPDIIVILEQNGFSDSGYSAQAIDEKTYTEASTGRSIMNYLFGSGKKALHKGVVLNYLGKKRKVGKKATMIGFPIGEFQKASGGHIAGAHFSDTGDVTTRSDLKDQGFSKKEFDLNKMVETPGTASFQFDGKKGSFLVNAFLLQMDSINMQFPESTIRIGKSDIKELKAKYYWQGTKETAGNNGYLHIKELSFRNLRSISNEGTIGIGLLKLDDLTVNINQPLGSSDELLGFYEAIIACLDQVMNILYLVLDSGLTVADRFFKGVGTEALTELNEIIGEFDKDLSISISIGGMEMQSLIDSKYASIDSIKLGKTDLTIGGVAFKENYKHKIDLIEKRASTQGRELSSEEQSQIDGYNNLIKNEERITELSTYMGQPDVENDADYAKNKAELDSLMLGRQMAINLSTSSLEIQNAGVQSGQTKIGADVTKFESFNAFAGMNESGAKQISADWGAGSLGVTGDPEKPATTRGTAYKDEKFDLHGGIAMDSGKYDWKEGEEDVLSMINPVLYSDKITLSDSKDLGMGRSDVSSTVLQILDKDVPFLKAQEVILKWPEGGGLIPNIEVVNPVITDLQFELKREVTIPVEQYVDEESPTASDWMKGTKIARLKKEHGDNVPLWGGGQQFKISGKIDGNLTLVQNKAENKWELKLAPNNEKKLSLLTDVSITSISREHKETRDGRNLIFFGHENSGDADKYPKYPEVEKKEEKLDFNFLDGLEETEVQVDLFGKSSSVQIDKGGYIAPAKALNQVYGGFLTQFNKSQLNRNLKAGSRRLADHLSGKSGGSMTSLALGWSWQEAYDNISYPLKMVNGLRFKSWVSEGYYQLATYNGGTLISTYKLAPATAETLSGDKKKIRLSSLIEYQLKTEKALKKPERSTDIVDSIVTSILDLFKMTWNEESLGSWLKVGKNLETAPTKEVVEKIDAWWEQSAPGLAIFGVGNYIATVAYQQGVAEGVISGLLHILVSSPMIATATGQYSIKEGSAKGTVGFAINQPMLPEFTIPNFTIERIDRNYENFQLVLSNLHLQNGIVKSKNWQFSTLEMSFPNTTLESLSVDWPIEKEKK